MNDNAYPYTARDLTILGLTVFGEARGESDGGKVAVAWTVRNRAEADLHRDGRPDWWGEGIAGVCLKSWQYSCWNQDGQDQSQRSRLLSFLVNRDLVEARLTNRAAADDVVARCMRAAGLVLDGEVLDPTAGATHYYATWIPEPKWARGREPSAVIGPHRFYNDVEPGYERGPKGEKVRKDPSGGLETPLLHRGSRGQAVRTVQHILNACANAGLFVDGIFGPATEMHVQMWQRSHGLMADGIVGPATWASLNKGRA